MDINDAAELLVYLVFFVSSLSTFLFLYLLFRGK